MRSGGFGGTEAWGLGGGPRGLAGLEEGWPEVGGKEFQSPEQLAGGLGLSESRLLEVSFQFLPFDLERCSSRRWCRSRPQRP